MVMFERNSAHLVWRSRYLARLQSLTPIMRKCLLEQGSLTLYLQRYCKPDFNFKLVDKRWSYPDQEAIQLLDLCVGETVLVREIVLNGRGLNLVFARTLIPRRTLEGRGRLLQYLDNRPIGPVLFADTHTVRQRVEYTRFTSNVLTAWGQAQQADHMVCGRRSLFRCSRKPVLITEFFLPAINCLVAQ